MFFLNIIIMCFFPIIFVSRLGYSESCASRNISEADLFDFLQKINPKYTESDRPRYNSSDPVKVNISINLYGITDFIQDEGTLLLEGYISAKWNDEFYRWKHEPCYSFIRCLVFIKKYTIWRPDFIILGDRRSEFQQEITSGAWVTICKDGNAEIFPRGRMGISCEPDLTFFPFDKQECSVYVESWHYDTSQQELFVDNFSRIDNFWYENSQWEIVGNHTGSTRAMYNTNNPDFTYSRLVFTLIMKRKPLFYVVNVIIPSIVIATSELAVFLLPNKEISKLSVSVTCLVAYSVFQSMINGDMPRSGRTVPLLSLYIDLQMAYIGLISILGNGITFYVASRADSRRTNPPPQWLFRSAKCVGLFVVYTAEVNKQQIISTAEKQADNDNVNSSGNSPQEATPKPASSINELEVTPKLAKEQWIFVANVIGRLNCTIYAGAVTLTPIIIFVMVPAAIVNKQ